MVETAGGRLHQRRGAASFVAANKTLLAAAWVVGFALVFLWQSASISLGSGGAGGGGVFLRLMSAPLPPSRPVPRLRPTAYNLTDFGGVGDGRALNTEAFERAVEAIAALAERGGGQLNVPPGRWLTAPFNLTSHMTLFLAEGAEILGIPDENYWPLMPALPSYGYGRERKGPRFGSLIHGQNLKDVVITGLFSNVTILSPVSGAPNTDGIDPEHWALQVRLTAFICFTCSAGISIGSEMSGGVANVSVENVRIWESRRGVRIKTATGRGGYIRNISYRNITFDNVRAGIVIKVDYNEHADDGYDRTAFPDITSISFREIHGWGVRVPVRAHGSDVIPIKDINFQDMSVGISYKKKHIFQCSYVEGRVVGSVFPKPCENLDVYNEQGQLVKRAVSLNSTELDYDF
ncbi:hypothetical protein HU200_041431 [Digitaria exilis]|uniref:Polygalacturonase n=1 Tax=Digitaria exilis TaxID=1010633 RepID=A0A835BCK6_9POAL|nr:hypothetical protein HU200_041431 [Digitaria exilis]